MKSEAQTYQGADISEVQRQLRGAVKSEAWTSQEAQTPQRCRGNIEAQGDLRHRHLKRRRETSEAQRHFKD
eukprot:1137624-Pelagomonas_calceolata.AAC.3